MTQVSAISSFSIALPVAVIFGSLLVSRFLRISLVKTVVAASLPLSLPFIDLPLAKEFSHGHPAYLIGGAWAVLLSGAIGYVMVRPVVSGAVASVGLLRLAYMLLLGSALGVVTLLMVNPEALSTYMPGWEGTAGFVLLSVSMLSMSLALARVLKAALLFAVWSFVSLVLASEVFLHKLPQEIVRDDLRRLEGVISSDRLHGLLDSFAATGADNARGLRAFVLGGSPTTGFPFTGDKNLSGRVQSLFQKAGLDVNVQDASVEGASIADLGRVVREKIHALRPHVVFIVGWAPDKEKGTLDREGEGALNHEASEQSSEISAVKTWRAITSSALYRYFSSVLVRSDDDERASRLTPQEYREELGRTVRSLRETGSTVVLISEPAVTPEDNSYRDAMLETAATEQALFVASDKVLAKTNDPMVFGRGSILSSRGYEAIAREAVELVRRTAPFASSSDGLGGAPEA